MRDIRPFRSVLYIPGANARALEKAKGLAADAIIFDLEDAVAADAKGMARNLLAQTLAGGGYGRRSQLIRINGLDTCWGAADLEAMTAIGPEAILLPKVESSAMIAEVAARLDSHPACDATRIWAMMETPRGILNAAEIASAPRLAGFVLGTNDLSKDLDCRFRADRLPLMTALQTCVMAARAEGLICVDGVYNSFKDIQGLQAEAEQGRDIGMDGKTVIHPMQIETVNQIFAPSAEDIDLARRQIAAFAAAQSRGLGVAVVDGRIVENLHVDSARVTLARADAISALSMEVA